MNVMLHGTKVQVQVLKLQRDVRYKKKQFPPEVVGFMCDTMKEPSAVKPEAVMP